MISPQEVDVRIANDEETIFSDFAADADMAGIIAMFVGELPQRIAELQSAFARGELEQVRTLGHQLKGAAGGYGFPTVGAAAALIDQGVKDGCERNVIRSRIGTLVALASRVR